MRAVKIAVSLAVAVLMPACSGPAAGDSLELATQSAALTTAVSRGCTFTLSYREVYPPFPPTYQPILTRHASDSCPWGEASVSVGASYNTPALSLAANDLGVAVSYTNKYSLSGSSTGVFLEVRHVAPDTLTVVRSETLRSSYEYSNAPIYSGELSLRTDTTGTALIVRGTKSGVMPGESGSGSYYTATYLNFFTSTTAPIITASGQEQVVTWPVMGYLTIPREGHTATLLNGAGNVLVVSNGTAEMYNPYINLSEPTPAPAYSRLQHTATWLQSVGKVLVVGGRDGSGPHRSAELYAEATNTWGSAGFMSTPRARHTATLLDSGKVLVVGGSSSNGDTNTAELYHPATNTWSDAAPVHMPRSGHTATLLYSGKVLVVGGNFYPFSDPQDAQIYDPETNTWTAAGAMSRGRGGHLALRLYSGFVMVMGGGYDEVDLYDPYNNVWSMGPSLPNGRWAVSATQLYTGEVVVTHSNRQTSLFDPSTNAWRSVGFLSAPLQGHAATRLHTGDVLVTGGSYSGTPVSTVQQYTP